MPAILDKIREKSAHIFNHIHEHPFVQQLHQDTLPIEKFEYYSEQDDLYLESWAKIILGLVDRLSSHPLSADPLFCNDLSFVQMHIYHVQIMIREGVFNPKRKESTFVPETKSELIDAYLNHLYRASQGDSIAIGLASLFACYDLYRQIGVYSKTMAVSATHRYYAWLSANYDAEFVGTAERIFNLTQRVVDFELRTDLLSNEDAIVDVASRSYHFEWEFFLEAIHDKALTGSYSR